MSTARVHNGHFIAITQVTAQEELRNNFICLLSVCRSVVLPNDCFAIEIRIMGGCIYSDQLGKEGYLCQGLN